VRRRGFIEEEPAGGRLPPGHSGIAVTPTRARLGRCAPTCGGTPTRARLGRCAPTCGGVYVDCAMSGSRRASLPSLLDLAWRLVRGKPPAKVIDREIQNMSEAKIDEFPCIFPAKQGVGIQRRWKRGQPPARHTNRRTRIGDTPPPAEMRPRPKQSRVHPRRCDG